MSLYERPPQLEAGLRVDRYQLLYPIAQGGMGEVWTARQHGSHGFEKLVALKTILPAHARDEAFRRMFLDEARIAAAIEHENVAQILDLGELTGLVYLTMEWVNGDSVAKMQRLLADGEHIPLGVAIRIVADACAGLHAAHELKNDRGELLDLVHRDVSPQNILVSTRGKAKLIDFGVAKAKERLSGETNSGMLKGKYRFMAPEQVRGIGIDRRLDIWAMGATAYHLLTGAYPVAGDNEAEVLVALLTGDALRPLPASVPPPVAEAVIRALKTARDERYATALEMQTALDAALGAIGQPTTTNDVAAYVTSRFADRIRARQEALNVAYEALKERSRVNRLLKVEMSHESTSAERNANARAGIDTRGDAVDLAAVERMNASTEPPPVREEAKAPDVEGNTMERAFFAAEPAAPEGTDALLAPVPPARGWRRIAAFGAAVAAVAGIVVVTRGQTAPPAAPPPLVAAATAAPAPVIPPPEPAAETTPPPAPAPPAQAPSQAPREAARPRAAHAAKAPAGPPAPASPRPAPVAPPAPHDPGDIERAIDMRK